MTSQYSSVQKLSLAGMVVGALMVIVATFAPYWIISDPKGFGEFDLVGKIVKGYLGLFMYCLEAVGQSHCEVIDMDNDSGWFHSARVAAAGCILLGGLAGGIALCLACCRCCKRFIVLGILSFLAAVAGAYCVGVFSKNTESFTGSILDFQVTSYGWAYYLFIAGVAILGVVSFTSCFAAPENPLRGMVLSQAPPNQVIVSTASTTTTTGHHPYMHLQEQGGPIMMGSTSATAVATNGY